MSNCYLKCEDESASVTLTSKCQGPGPMKIYGPCVVDMDLIKGEYLLRGIRYDNDQSAIQQIDYQYDIGDIIIWNDNYFLVRDIDKYSYDTLSIATGSAFNISLQYAHDHTTLEA